MAKKTQDSSRILEKDVWKEYCPAIKTLSERVHVIAYQWKWKAKGGDSEYLDDFSMFIKSRHDKTNRRIMGKVLIYVLLVSIVASWVANQFPTLSEICNKIDGFISSICFFK